MVQVMIYGAGVRAADIVELAVCENSLKVDDNSSLMAEK